MKIKFILLGLLILSTPFALLYTNSNEVQLQPGQRKEISLRVDSTEVRYIPEFNIPYKLNITTGSGETILNANKTGQFTQNLDPGYYTIILQSTADDRLMTMIIEQRGIPLSFTIYYLGLVSILLIAYRTKLLKPIIN